MLLSGSGSSSDKITSELTHLMGSLPPSMQALTGVNLAQVRATDRTTSCLTNSNLCCLQALRSFVGQDKSTSKA